MHNYKLAPDISEINPKPEDCVNFYLPSLQFFTLLIFRTAIFCFDELHFLLAVGDMLEQKFFSILDLDSLVDNIKPPPHPHPNLTILKYFHSQYRSPYSKVMLSLLTRHYYSPVAAFSMYLSSESKLPKLGNFSCTVSTMKCNSVIFLSVDLASSS